MAASAAPAQTPVPGRNGWQRSVEHQTDQALVSLLLGKLTTAAREVARHLGDATQLQLIVSSAARQVDVLEEYLCATAIRTDVGDVSAVTSRSVDLIQVYAEPPGEPEQRLAQARPENGG